MAVLACGGCTDGPDLKGKIDKSAIDVLSRQGSVATYERVDVQLYNKDAWSKGKWEEVDLSDYVGWSPSLPATLVFQDGQLWRELQLFFSWGPHVLSAPWNAYLRATGNKISLYTAPKFYYDEAEQTFDVGDYANYDVIDFTDSKLTLSATSTYYGGRTGEGGEHLEMLSYRITDPVILDGPDVKAFATTKEAYRYILDCAREEFGRYIDLNDIYYPSVIFDDPIIDLDEIEEYLSANGEI